MSSIRRVIIAEFSIIFGDEIAQQKIETSSFASMRWSTKDMHANAQYNVLIVENLRWSCNSGTCPSSLHMISCNMHLLASLIYMWFWKKCHYVPFNNRDTKSWKSLQICILQLIQPLDETLVQKMKLIKLDQAKGFGHPFQFFFFFLFENIFIPTSYYSWKIICPTAPSDLFYFSLPLF